MTDKTLTPVDMYTAGTIASNLVEGAAHAQTGSNMLADSARDLANLYATSGGPELAIAELRTMLVAQEEEELSLLSRARANPHSKALADEIGYARALDTLTETEVKKAVKNRRDAALTAIRRALKRIGRDVSIGKQRAATEKSIRIVKLVKPAPTPANPAGGRETGRVVQPTTGEPTREVQPVSESDAVAMLIAAFDALSADGQDNVAIHVLSVLESRKPAPNGTHSLGAHIRKAQAAASHSTH